MTNLRCLSTSMWLWVKTNGTVLEPILVVGLGWLGYDLDFDPWPCGPANLFVPLQTGLPWRTRLSDQRRSGRVADFFFF